MKIAEPTVARLVQYHRLLERLYNEGQKVVSSQEMGELLNFKASQVRKDLSYFGEIGKRGVGYHVERLFKHIDEILSPPRQWKMALVGLGHLGTALLGYGAFKNTKFGIQALFDNDQAKVGKAYAGIPCHHIKEAPSVIRDKGIEVIILTVPAEAAQNCIDIVSQSGRIKGVLNFSPVSIVVPDTIRVYSVDISVELEKLLFYLKQNSK
ncbi:MAG: redox-sensing transcriptional repressor Rex [Synergistales bacterium]|nr:redox-sensing transcriptional repressor Rex [Synergistales bacterium]